MDDIESEARLEQLAELARIQCRGKKKWARTHSLVITESVFYKRLPQKKALPTIFFQISNKKLKIKIWGRQDLFAKKNPREDEESLSWSCTW